MATTEHTRRNKNVYSANQRWEKAGKAVQRQASRPHNEKGGNRRQKGEGRFSLGAERERQALRGSLRQNGGGSRVLWGGDPQEGRQGKAGACQPEAEGCFGDPRL